MYAYEKKKKKRKSKKFKEKEIQEMCDNQLHSRNTPRYSAAAGQYFLISAIADSKKCSVLAFAALINSGNNFPSLATAPTVLQCLTMLQNI